MIVSATGHRPDKLGGYNNKTASLNLLILAVDWLAEHKPEKVISGMALGWDMVVAKAAIILDIPLVAAIPFAGQELAWPEESQRIYHRILTLASEQVVVSKGGFTAKKMQVRNQWMVDNSDMVLAMWDGSLGGTCNCIRYANSVNKPIVNLFDQFKP